MVKNGMLFLKPYSKLAFLAYTLGRPLFKHSMEAHYMHPYLNPLSYSCESAEDFIGRVFLLSKRAASGSAHARALQTWLAVSLGQWTADRSRAQRPRPRKCRYDSYRAFPNLPIPRRTHSQLPGPSGILCLKPSAQILQPLDYHNYENRPVRRTDPRHQAQTLLREPNTIGCCLVTGNFKVFGL